MESEDSRQTGKNTNPGGKEPDSVCVGGGGGMPMQRRSTLEGTTIMVGEAWWRQRQLSTLLAECEVLTHIWIDGNIETNMRQAVGPG